MKPLDQFKRTPPRRYDKAPPPPPGDKRTFEPAIRKRYFDMPTFDHRHIDRWLGGAVCAVLLLTLCNASAPMGDVPSVQERFSQWAVIQNEKTVQQLSWQLFQLLLRQKAPLPEKIDGATEASYRYVPHDPLFFQKTDFEKIAPFADKPSSN